MNTGICKNLFRLPIFLSGWLGAAVLAQAHADQPMPAVPTVITKTVRQYALTSANDFPQRDPEDWRLLASNDGGLTWAVLDVRKGESFSGRHERHVYPTANKTAYNLYRLEIDRVHDPVTADAVQLAALDLMGEPGDDFSPMPLFCDLITAQGENGPTETAYKVFDDQVMTKWLDKAAQHPDTRASWIQWQYLDQAALVITNLNHLLSLHARANEGFPVRIEGILVGPVPGHDRWCVLDSSGHIEIDNPEPGAKLSPGQRILLAGISQLREGQVGVSQLHVKPLGPKAPETPKPIEPEQAILPDEEWRWVEAEGQIQFLTQPDDRLEFELSKNGHNISVHILHWDPAQKAPPSGANVRVQGLCGGVLNENGDRVAGIILAPSLAAVSLVAETKTSANSSEDTSQKSSGANTDPSLMPIDRIRQFSWDELASKPKVKIRGVVTELFGNCVQDESGGIEIWLDDKVLPQVQGLGAYVEIEGFATRAVGHGATGYGTVVQAEKITFLGKGKLPNPERPSWSLLASGQRDAQWVEVDAVVRATDGSHLLLASESGELMATIRAASVSDVNRLVDATIRMRGVCFAATDERVQLQGIQLLVPSMEYVEVRQLPVSSFAISPRKIDTLFQVRGPRENIHRVKIAGVVTYCADNNYFIQDSSGSVKAIAKQNVTLNLPSWGWWAFWQNEGASTNSSEKTEVKVGDQVEALGFPETHGYAPVLTEAILRDLGRASPVKPVQATVNKLAQGKLDSALVTLDGLLLGGESLGSIFELQIQSDQKVFQAFLPIIDRHTPDLQSGSRIRVTGICQMDPLSHEGLGKSTSTFSLLLRNSADVSLLERPPWLTVKQTLLVVGVLALILLGALVWIRLLHRQVEARTHQLKQEISEHEATEAQLSRKTQLLQSEIKEHERTEAALAEKTGLLEGEIAERKLIQVELEEKKTSLEHEIEGRKRVQAEVEKIHKQLLTTSRMAGMADLATNVLHNVGNVLNSVNVVAASIVTNVQMSKMPSVAKLAGLLAQHRSDLGRFMTDDTNGKHVPDLLGSLGAHLLEEQSRLLDKAQSLTESTRHIKEIVAVQQNYAKASGVFETVLLAEVVEDALKMCGGALARHGIKVVRDYEEVPPVTLDRDKVLQIVFNLLDNAKYAYDECAGVEKRVTLRIRKCPDERIRLEVLDNGIGIQQENLKRIFTQGFSTRRNGHGFGLHSSILAAQDMDGSLTVHSDGPGTGCAFALEIPLTVKYGAASAETAASI